MRLVVAAVRGLLLDRLATGEHDAVDDAFSVLVERVVRRDSAA
jgi:hypothetical protein